MEDLSGRQLGLYQLLAPLGQGGMAAVYSAYQPTLERQVALKVLPRQFSADPQFAARFRREARLIANLEHPNILPVYDFGEADGYPFIVMRYVEGSTLADQLKGKPLPMEQIRLVIRQVGDALDYAHEAGVIHRDVKPSNILVDRQGNCLLSDFGLAKMIEGDTHLTMTGTIMGTPAYMSPEQGLGDTLDKRTDVYSLGVVLYEMAVGKVPYEAETPMAVVHKHIYDPLPLPRKANPNLPERVEAVIIKSLAKQKTDRYSTTASLADALEHASQVAYVGLKAKDKRQEATPDQTDVETSKVMEAEPVPLVSPRKRLPRAALQPPTLGARGIHLPSRRIFLPALVFIALIAGGVGLFSLLAQDSVLSLRATPPPTGSPVEGANPSATTTALSSVTDTVSGEVTLQPTAPTSTAVDGPSPSIVRTLEAKDVVDLAWSPDGAILAIGGQSLSLWIVASDTQSDIQLGVPIALSGDNSRFQRDSSLGWRSDGTMLEVSGFRRPVWILNTDGTGDVKTLDTEKTGGVITAAWSPQGEYLGMGNASGDTVLWDPSSGAYAYLQGNRRELASSVAWSPDGAYLASASWDATIQVWHIPTRTRVRTLTGFIGAVSGLEWSPDGAYLASTDLFAGDIVIWDTAHWSRERTIKGNVAWSSDSTLFAIIGEEGVTVETGAGEVVVVLPRADEVQWSPDGGLLAAAADKEITILRTDDWSQAYSIEGGAQPMEWSPDGRDLAAIGADGNVSVWEFPSAP